MIYDQTHYHHLFIFFVVFIVKEKHISINLLCHSQKHIIQRLQWQ
jgi:hypothetical protein